MRSTFFAVLLVSSAACGSTEPGPAPATFDLAWVWGVLLTQLSGPVPHAVVFGSDTNWTLNGRLTWDSHRRRYRILIHGVLVETGVRTPWDVIDSGTYEPSSWQCTGCMPYRLISDQHFDPEGEIRFIPDTTSGSADVYNLAGNGSWYYTFTRP